MFSSIGSRRNDFYHLTKEYGENLEEGKQAPVLKRKSSMPSSFCWLCSNGKLMYTSLFRYFKAQGMERKQDFVSRRPTSFKSTKLLNLPRFCQANLCLLCANWKLTLKKFGKVKIVVQSLYYKRC